MLLWSNLFHLQIKFNSKIIWSRWGLRGDVHHFHQPPRTLKLCVTGLLQVVALSILLDQKGSVWCVRFCLSSVVTLLVLDQTSPSCFNWPLNQPLNVVTSSRKSKHNHEHTLWFHNASHPTQQSWLFAGVFHVVLPHLVMGSLCVLSAAATFLLPESFRKPLPETLEEMHEREK